MKRIERLFCRSHTNLPKKMSLSPKNNDAESLKNARVVMKGSDWKRVGVLTRRSLHTGNDVHSR
jgi:hypothetical protein